MGVKVTINPIERICPAPAIYNKLLEIYFNKYNK